MFVEKRRFTRLPFRVKAEMTVNDVLYSAEEINNLSVGGCLLPITADLEPGSACHVRILLSGTSSELSLRVAGNVVRCDYGAIAVKFTDIDPDNLFHLQNIVRHNSSDPDAVERELRNYPGLV
ncbi:MAG: PilZ domain-containing protein [Deltaproteobacteria bacterium]|nr:PilZ domain-containing protein [Deltaproteobacteria bacterium]